MNARFSLAVHILCLLAEEPEGRLTSEYLALSIGANAVVIRRLLATLRRAGLVSSKSAGGGGWKLAHAPARITLNLVRQAVNEGERAKLHRNAPHPDCPVGRGVRGVLMGVYTRADAAMDRELAEISVATILDSVLKMDPTIAIR